MKRILIVPLGMCALICLPALARGEETAHAPVTEKSLHWADTNRAVSVFLVQRQTNPPTLTKTFSLFVAGGEDLAVIYRTSRNSRIPVVRELTPKATSSIKGMREFEFRHGFSRTTSWMAIVFKKDDQRIDELTRTFYGSIDKVVDIKPFLRTSGGGNPQQPPERDK